MLTEKIAFLDDLDGHMSDGTEKPVVKGGPVNDLLACFDVAKDYYKLQNSIQGNFLTLRHLDCFENEYIAKMDYSERDIQNLVASMQYTELEGEEPFFFGMYVGSLISTLTQRNEERGQETMIVIPENKLDYLGTHCRKFDVVRFGINYGKSVFSGARCGSDLSVKVCEGKYFAQGACMGSPDDRIGRIRAGLVYGDNFADYVCSRSGEIQEISAELIEADEFAHRAGEKGGHVGMINVGVVCPWVEDFCLEAGLDSYIDELNVDYCKEDSFRPVLNNIGKINRGNTIRQSALELRKRYAKIRR